MWTSDCFLVFLQQKLRDKVGWLGIVLEDIIKFTMEMGLLGETVDKLLEIHLTFDEQELNSAGIGDVTKRLYNFREFIEINFVLILGLGNFL